MESERGCGWASTHRLRQSLYQTSLDRRMSELLTVAISVRIVSASALLFAKVRLGICVNLSDECLHDHGSVGLLLCLRVGFQRSDELVDVLFQSGEIILGFRDVRSAQKKS